MMIILLPRDEAVIVDVRTNLGCPAYNHFYQDLVQCTQYH